MVAAAGANSSSTLCIACTLILTLLEEKALLSGGGGGGGMELLGQLLLQQQQQQHTVAAGAPALPLPSPDALCRELKLCDGYPTCNLFPGNSWPPPTNATATAATTAAHAAGDGSDGADDDELWHILRAGGLAGLRETIVAAAPQLPLASGLSHTPVAQQQRLASLAVGGGQDRIPDPCGTNLSCLVFRLGTLHQPLLDVDGDNFAPRPVGGVGLLGGLLARRARGSHWRGADCNDADANIYPGRRATVSGDVLEDTNCNGIHGVEPQSHEPYEKLWCAGALEPRGVIVLGDSASAHFHIPPDWLEAANFSVAQLLQQAPLAADELDYPMCSWSTGHSENASVAEQQCPGIWRRHGGGIPPPSLPLKSFYARLRQRNVRVPRERGHHCVL
jgi:hypothetical protein